jgi:hypothetical protein
MDINVLRFSNHMYVFMYPFSLSSTIVVATYVGTFHHLPAPTRVGSRIDPRVHAVDVVIALTNNMLPHSTLAVCSPPTPLAGCDDLVFTVDPTVPT